LLSFTHVHDGEERLARPPDLGAPARLDDAQLGRRGRISSSSSVDESRGTGPPPGGDVEDVVQEAICRMLEAMKVGQFDSARPIWSYLMGIVNRLLVDDPNCSAMDHSECSHSLRCIEHVFVDVAFCCEYTHHEEGGVCKVEALCKNESSLLGSCAY
jgi:hypothetical protein